MRLTKLFSRTSSASSPREFDLKDWKEALGATKAAISEKRVGIMAAGIAYFMTLAFFPLIAATIAIAGYVLEPQQIRDFAQGVEQFFPRDIADLANDQLVAALKDKQANLIIALISIGLALFSISGAVQNAIGATNASYDVDESRSFVRLRLASLSVMGIFFLNGLLIGLLLLLNVDVMREVGIYGPVAISLSALRWVILPLILGVTLSLFYRYGPNRSKPQWQWVTWGSAIAALLWLLVTVGFLVYARYFANFSESYGTFAGIIVLMTWFNLSSLVILVGAEINHRLELQTVRSTKK